MSILIKPMKFIHLQEVLKIERASFKAPWSKKSFCRELQENPYAVYFVAVLPKDGNQQSKVIAYIGGWIINKELHITNLAVKSEYRKKGLAKGLIDRIINYALKRRAEWAALEVRFSNDAAINLYKSMGFRVAGLKPDYYSNDSEDALIMWRKIKDEHEKGKNTGSGNIM